MPLFLIRINKRNWDRDGYPWLGQNQVPADVHQDFRIKHASLSVWHIEDNRSNLQTVICALAATRDTFDVFDYGLFEQQIVTNIGIKIKITDGIVPIQHAKSWHRDLVELTVDNVALLLNSIFTVMIKERILKNEVRNLVCQAVQQGKVDLSLVNEKMRNQIAKSLDKP